MNTPITNAAEFPAHRATRFHHGEDPLVDASVARRLETDRSALMDALQWLDNWLGHKPMPECSKRIADALAAARANFPEP